LSVLFVLKSVLKFFKFIVLKKKFFSCAQSYMVQVMPPPPIIYCFIKIQNGSAFTVLAYPGCLWKMAVKWVY